MIKEILIGFSSHRVETLDLAEKIMQEADFIFLEEPQDKLLQKFLKNEISLNEYLESKDFQFPLFAERVAILVKKLYNRNKKIFAVEPYLESLQQIYQLLEEGKSPSKILENEKLKKVYQIENKVTGALLEFYKASLFSDFDTLLEKVKKFSKLDAERFRLRDEMRAEAIIKNLPSSGKIYIEAGTIHLYLKKCLKEKLKNDWVVRSKYLLEDFVKKKIGKRWLYPPGELLTLRYIWGAKENKKLENLLSARSLVYILLIEKEELLPTEHNPFPHLKEELRIIQELNLLSFSDCQILYHKLRFKKRKEALKIFKNYCLKKRGST